MTIASGSSQPRPSQGEIVEPCIVVQRIYERLNPDLDEWAKDVAPTQELRRWYDHDPLRFDEFCRRYRRELRRAPCADIVRRLLGCTREAGITLLTATRDVEHSGARVLQQHMLANGDLRSRKAT